MDVQALQEAARKKLATATFTEDEPEPKKSKKKSGKSKRAAKLAKIDEDNFEHAIVSSDSEEAPVK